MYFQDNVTSPPPTLPSPLSLTLNLEERKKEKKRKRKKKTIYRAKGQLSLYYLRTHTFCSFSSLHPLPTSPNHTSKLCTPICLLFVVFFWPVAMWFATMWKFCLPETLHFLNFLPFLAGLIFFFLLCICVFCGSIPRLLYLLQLENKTKKGGGCFFILCLFSPTLPLIYKYCNAQSPEILTFIASQVILYSVS